MNPRELLASSLAVASVVLAGCGRSPPPVSPPAPRAVITDGMVDVGGVSLHVHCLGEGTPTVVLDAGLGDDATTWRDTQPEIARFTRVCAYDRAGMGYSGPAPRLHTSQQMARELHALLQRAALDGPYVLVGHSFGGLSVRLFASEHPTDVAGMVLVDVSTEEQDTRYWSLLPEDQQTAFKAGLADAPDGVDFEAFRTSLAQLRSANRSLGATPLVVLTSGRTDREPGIPAEVMARMGRAWQELQAELPRLSSNSAQFVVPDSGHFIYRERPRFFVASVRVVVDAARTHAPVDKTVLSDLARKWAALSTEQAITRLFTGPVVREWFAASFLRQVPDAELEAVPTQLAASLGTFKRVARDGEQFVVEFERGSVPTEAVLDEDGRFVSLLFHAAVPAAEPAAPTAPTPTKKAGH